VLRKSELAISVGQNSHQTEIESKVSDLSQSPQELRPRGLKGCRLSHQPNGPGSKGREGPAAPKAATIVPGAACSLPTGGRGGDQQQFLPEQQLQQCQQQQLA